MKEPTLDYAVRLGRLLAATVGLWVAAQANFYLFPDPPTSAGLAFAFAGIAGLALLLVAAIGRKEVKGP